MRNPLLLPHTSKTVSAKSRLPCLTGGSRDSAEAIFSLSALESKLVSYISDPDSTAQPFDVSAIPKISREQLAKEAARKSNDVLILRLHLSCV